MAFLDHIITGFTLGFHNRHGLASLMRNTAPDCSIAAITPEQLYNEGIRILALDFDGVLSPHGASKPIPAAEEWLRCCTTVFGEENLFVLSNKPTQERKEWFSEKFPSLRFISGVRKKPFPDGLNKIGELSQAPLATVLMVDDRLLTGCLAAITAGARPCYIRKPYVSFSDNALPEIFFASIRIAERLFVSLCTVF
jgi:predicted HAD superfamily phosphohydrolase YqeG